MLLRNDCVKTTDYLSRTIIHDWQASSVTTIILVMDERVQTLYTRYQQVETRLEQHYGKPQPQPPLPPLDELILTILSQNTNDRNRDVAFKALQARFPNWEAVRDAPLDDVIAAIRPDGLANQKGARIQAVLQTITAERGTLDLTFLHTMSAGQVRAWLTKFKGVGPKTAAIVLLFSLGKPAFPVDTRVHRITGRLGLRPNKMSANATHTHFEMLLPDNISAADCYSIHVNLIRLGRQVCQARRPDCSNCPLHDLCHFYQNNRQDDR